MRIKEIKETTASHKTMLKLVKYLNNKYGSLVSFKLLKYFLEHKLAREKNGYTVYELSFNIPPSLVLTRSALIKIECLADGAIREDAERGLDLLIQKGILGIDKETGILELTVPLNSIADVYLIETKHGFETVEDISSATLILLPTATREVPTEKTLNGFEPNIAGVPDMLIRKKNGKYTLVESKFG